MMKKLSKKEELILLTCDIRLQIIIRDLINIFPIKIIEGYREKELQDRFFAEKKTKLKYPQSKHNSKPSLAIDIAPDPIDYTDTERFFYMAGMFKALAHKHGINIVWGGDWDNDTVIKEEVFRDLSHFEIV